ncbi:hypothetical protein Acr_14g0002180 [Actinidia rufa]|uniref:Uncharacterized protein n=1 Tax=Actinidia rufa TaxID=165716 RepID=A0A7J0FPD3_9ERIC|nr:hypothetical protein Acr_14g0002180 [Actinidia rufa]
MPIVVLSVTMLQLAATICPVRKLPQKEWQQSKEWQTLMCFVELKLIPKLAHNKSEMARRVHTVIASSRKFLTDGRGVKEVLALLSLCSDELVSAKGALNLFINLLSSQQLPENASRETIGCAYHTIEIFVRVALIYLFLIFCDFYYAPVTGLVFVKSQLRQIVKGSDLSNNSERGKDADDSSPDAPLVWVVRRADPTSDKEADEGGCLHSSFGTLVDTSVLLSYSPYLGLDELTQLSTWKMTKRDAYTHLSILWSTSMFCHLIIVNTWCITLQGATDLPHEECIRSLLQLLNWHGVVLLEGKSIDVDLVDARSAAEALARSKHVESAHEKSNEMQIKKALIGHSFDGQGFSRIQASCFDCQHTNALKTLGENAGTRKMKCNLNTSEAYGFLTEHISERQRLKSAVLHNMPNTTSPITVVKHALIFELHPSCTPSTKDNFISLHIGIDTSNIYIREKFSPIHVTSPLSNPQQHPHRSPVAPYNLSHLCGHPKLRNQTEDIRATIVIAVKYSIVEWPKKIDYKGSFLMLIKDHDQLPENASRETIGRAYQAIETFVQDIAVSAKLLVLFAQGLVFVKSQVSPTAEGSDLLSNSRRVMGADDSSPDAGSFSMGSQSTYGLSVVL